MSEVFKENNAVTDGDLREYARECLEEQAQLKPVQFGDFLGYCAHYERDRLSWSEYWLRCGGMLLYVTHNAGPADEGAALLAVESMLASLRASPDLTARGGIPGSAMLG